MAKKGQLEKEILKRYASLEYATDRLGPGSLMTQESHINSSRLIMVNHQLSDMVNIKDPEMPLVPTGFENPLSKLSSMIIRSDGDYKIIKKFEKNPYNYILIGYDEKRKVYHAWRRVETKSHSENYSTRYNNSFIDSLEEGDVVEKDKIVTKSDSFDKSMNYRYGKNLNIVYMSAAQVLEDGILVMNGADHKMNVFCTVTHVINLNDNEILLNLYGDDDHYQGLPLVGEKTLNGIIAAVRRVDNNKAPYSLKKKRMRTIERGDEKHVGNGRVIDIEILYNKDLDKMPSGGANKLLKDIYEAQQKYYMTVYKYMTAIHDKAKAESNGVSCSDEFNRICDTMFTHVDSSAYFTDGNDGVFGNMQIKVTMIEEQKLVVGSKLVGRSGNKGVISRILPPEKSWKMEDGTPIDLVVAALGVVGRLNQAQLNEHSINELSNTAVEMMKQTSDVDQKGKIVVRLLKFLDCAEAKAFKRYFEGLSTAEKEKVCRQIEHNGIYIVQDPIDNADMFNIGEAYKEFPAKYQRIVFPDGRKSMRKVLCAKMFFVRLKQDPIEKYSVRSRGPVSPLTLLPNKSTLKKRGLEAYSDVPVRLGEYELEVLLAMINHPAAIANYMMENSTSWPAKMIMAEHNYFDDLGSDTMDMSEVEFTGKKNLEAIAAHINVLGSKIEMEYEEAPEGEYFTD